jgi:2-phosphosulfolactate phosphatase
MNSSQTSLEVLFAPAEFEALSQRDLSQTVCVVFDILRATSSMVTALGNGASAIIPVAEIPEALAIRRSQPDVLLAGERDGLRIHKELTGGTDFDLGNSPREFTANNVTGKSIAMTTTNGTKALRACSSAQQILVGSFLNLRQTADYLEKLRPSNLLLVCGGTFEQAAYEDILAAGALTALLWTHYLAGSLADSAFTARKLFLSERENLAAALGQSRNGKRLLSRPDLKDDVLFCAQRDAFPILAALGKDGHVRQIAA